MVLLGIVGVLVAITAVSVLLACKGGSLEDRKNSEAFREYQREKGVTK